MTTSTQAITPALREWIIDQTRAGHRPEAVLEAMKASGWREEVALSAMETVLSGLLKDHAAPPDAMPTANRVPEPVALVDGSTAMTAHDREVKVVMSLGDPRVVVFANVLSDDECDEIVALASARLSRSHTVDVATGNSEINAARTSEGMFFTRGEHPVCARLESRIAALLDWPVDHGEGLQVLRYGPGAEYKPHYDYFDPAQPGTASLLKRGGQRVGTFIVYLNNPVRGGATTFPDVGLDVAPVKGHAVFFSYDRPHPTTRSLHGGAPLLEGEKWVATKWLRVGRFE